MKIWALLLLLGLSYSVLVVARTEIKVGGYDFPPFVNEAEGQVNGITLSLIELLNTSQDRYHFVFVATTAKRRHKDFDDNLFDLMFFENTLWGWQGLPVVQSKVFHEGDETFIALRNVAKTQQYFDDLQGKLLGGVQGYHYRIANFERDPKVLEQRYNLLVSKDHVTNINLLINRKIDVAIVSRSFINNFLQEHPQLAPKLIIAQRIDQKYQHRVLIRQAIDIKPEHIDEMLELLRREGKLDKLLKRKLSL